MVQLLVSVRNAAEASAALAGGAHIIDVKEPLNGPLGFAGWDQIATVSAQVGGAVPVSAALGECCEWQTKSSVVPVAVPERFPMMMKLGLAGLADGTEKSASWESAWLEVRKRFDQRAVDRGSGIQWVAVAYADAERAESPSAEAVLAAACRSGCVVLLLDTFLKDGHCLFDWFSPAELRDLRERAHRVGMKLALAGQLSLEHLPQICDVAPDIMAVRGAACEDRNREATICEHRVRQLQMAIRDARAVNVSVFP
ncbi:MAG: (5-formylfuran-3-yl)methyl phosphate synthase [Planctomycetaceae bacterium]